MLLVDRYKKGVSIDLKKREKLILSGLYFSKYDETGLKILGFETFNEAFNVIGYGLGAKPASIKNYRDEFDPHFENARKGWHKRDTRAYCLDVLARYESMDFETFTALVRSFFVDNTNAEPEYVESDNLGQAVESNFAQRLITGLAAEQYFESIKPTINEFRDYRLENTTRLGCGYDFRLWGDSVEHDFLAIEVKGLKYQTGSISMTPKEFKVATDLGDKYYLFVVRNFVEKPKHNFFRNPLAGDIEFKRVERICVQVSWTANISVNQL